MGAVYAVVQCWCWTSATLVPCSAETSASAAAAVAAVLSESLQSAKVASCMPRYLYQATSSARLDRGRTQEGGSSEGKRRRGSAVVPLARLLLQVVRVG